jgi:hypothetical protein
MLKRQRQSSKMTNEQIQRKLIENGIFKDDLSKNTPVNTYILFITISLSFFSYYVHENEHHFHQL